MYVDSLVPVYTQIMNALPPQKRKVMAIILGAYKGITPTEIARRGFLDVNTVTSVVGRLHKAGMVDRRRMGRNSLYWVRDRDFLLFYAMRADHAWRSFYEERRHRYDEPLIDEFITQQNRG
jgi:DNA-binding MarR family transcriptional regulator